MPEPPELPGPQGRRLGQTRPLSALQLLPYGSRARIIGVCIQPRLGLRIGTTTTRSGGGSSALCLRKRRHFTARRYDAVVVNLQKRGDPVFQRYKGFFLVIQGGVRVVHNLE